MNRRSYLILSVSRFAGYVFALALIGIIGLSALPSHYFLVSNRAVINAPIQSITSRIAGRVTNLDLQIGEDVSPGQRAASIENVDSDSSILISLRLERLQLNDVLKQVLSTEERTARQIELMREQIDATRRGVIDELHTSLRKAENNVRFYEARVREQQSLIDQKQLLVERGLLDPVVVRPFEEKKEAARQELETAKGELKRQAEISASIEKGDYSGGFATNLMALEFQLQSLDMENKRAAAERASVSERIAELDRLVSTEETRIAHASSAAVNALHGGRVVSLEASMGDYVGQGGLIARSLDCSKSFVAAVFAGRDVVDIEVGTPAIVNIRSLGTKERGRIAKTVRYFNDGNESRYYKPFPKADGHEIYVIVELEKQSGGQQTRDDLFFGCHVGEEVTVALGEPLTERVSRFLQGQAMALAGMLPAGLVNVARAQSGGEAIERAPLAKPGS